MDQDILGRINQFKDVAMERFHVVSDILRDKFHQFTDKGDEIPQIKIDNYQYESHYPDDDDLQLTLAKGDGPGVQFYETENSPLSRGQPKSAAHGIDKFSGEDDESFEEDIRRAGQRRKMPTGKIAPKTRKKKDELH